MLGNLNTHAGARTVPSGVRLCTFCQRPRVNLAIQRSEPSGLPQTTLQGSLTLLTRLDRIAPEHPDILRGRHIATLVPSLHCRRHNVRRCPKQ